MKGKILGYVDRLKRTPNRGLRITVGSLLVIGGILGALPILGFWMIPLGLAVLSVDFAWARRATAWLKRCFERIRIELAGPRWHWWRRIVARFKGTR